VRTLPSVRHQATRICISELKEADGSWVAVGKERARREAAGTMRLHFLHPQGDAIHVADAGSGLSRFQAVKYLRLDEWNLQNHKSVDEVNCLHGNPDSGCDVVGRLQEP
jgi:hypothetical protein